MVAETPNGITNGENVGVGEKCEIRKWKEHYNKRGKLVKFEREGSEKDEGPRDDSPFALETTRVHGLTQQDSKGKLFINSPHLLKAFRKVIGVDPRWPVSFEKPVTIAKPYSELLFHWHGLERYRESSDDENARRHIDLLLEFLEQDIGDTKRYYDKLLGKRQVNFHQLWMLYQPGALLYNKEHEHGWLLRLRSTQYAENKTEGQYFYVHCTYTDHDGNKLGRAYIPFTIHQRSYFPGDSPCNIDELPVYPAEFLPDQGAVEAKCQERGCRYLELTGVQVKDYHGQAQFLRGPPKSPPDQKGDEDNDAAVFMPYTEHGRVVLDRKTYHEEVNHIDVEESPASDEQGEPEKMLLPPYVYGYSLGRKFWCRLHIANLQDTKFDENAFDHLVLEENQKSVLRALIMSNGRGEKMEEGDKGKGLVVMMHGTTGTGKTLTAESAAEISKRPLFTTTIRDLMKSGPAWFEGHIKRILRYAVAWKAVVLLEEADEFLEAVLNRTVFETVEAAFLRQLESFSGIIFMTTNRIKAFDPAMLSRVHISIEFKPPGRELRREMWVQHLKRCPASETEVDPEQAVEELLQEPLNGREIANTVSNARTLASFEEKKLQMQHLKSVLAMRTKFGTSLRRERDALYVQPTRETHLYM